MLYKERGEKAGRPRDVYPFVMNGNVWKCTLPAVRKKRQERKKRKLGMQKEGKVKESIREVNKQKTKKCVTETPSEKRREIMSVSRGENEVSAFVSLSLSVALSLAVRLQTRREYLVKAWCIIHSV